MAFSEWFDEPEKYFEYNPDIKFTTERQIYEYLCATVADIVRTEIEEVTGWDIAKKPLDFSYCAKL